MEKIDKKFIDPVEETIAILKKDSELLEKHTYRVIFRYIEEEGKKLKKIGLASPEFRADVIKSALLDKGVDVSDVDIEQDLSEDLAGKIFQTYSKFVSEQKVNREWTRRNLADAAAHEKRVTRGGSVV